MSLPSTHAFLMRNIIHHHNNQKNLRRLEAFRRDFGTEVGLNTNHQALLDTSEILESSTKSATTDDPQVTNLSGSEGTEDILPLPDL